MSEPGNAADFVIASPQFTQVDDLSRDIVYPTVPYRSGTDQNYCHEAVT